jgi:hypothetical protein
VQAAGELTEIGLKATAPALRAVGVEFQACGCPGGRASPHMIAQRPFQPFRVGRVDAEAESPGHCAGPTVAAGHAAGRRSPGSGTNPKVGSNSRGALRISSELPSASAQ